MENKEYIATFYAHFGAIRFKKSCDQNGYQARIMPVPRNLSSSCGTCVRWTGQIPDFVNDEIEQIAVVLVNGYEICYRAKDS